MDTQEWLERLAPLVGAEGFRLLRDRQACYFYDANRHPVALVHGEPGAWLLATVDRVFARPSTMQTFDAALADFCEQVRLVTPQGER
jgi:hypothetical protein